MSPSFKHLALSALTLVGPSFAHYTLKDDMSGKNFFSAFNFFNGHDPTDGFVQFQTLDQSIANQYIGYLDDGSNSVYIGVDYTNKTPSGRPSVRLESKKTYNKGLLIADITHMPASTCGTWPAFWMFQDPWPQKGEIDIIEGVNNYDANSVTLHTSAGCKVDNNTSSAPTTANAQSQSAFLGNMLTSDCDVNAANQDKNQGCSIHAGQASYSNSTTNNYGSGFNDIGGGVYAMEWTSTSISVWFFPRHGPAQDFNAPDPSKWGSPMARFSGSGCDFNARFKDLKIVFDITFCGQWSGREWQSGGCAAKTKTDKCEDYVRDNPQAFAETYWNVAGLKWFETDGDAKREVVHQKGRRYAW